MDQRWSDNAMRLIGHLKDEGNAKVFGNFLTGLEISNHVEPDTDGTWAVWVHSEDQLEAGRDWLARYTANPRDPMFAQGQVKAAEVREREEREQKDYEKRVRTPDNIWQRSGQFGALTVILMVVCIGLFIYSFTNGGRLHALLISVGGPMLWEVREGQVWRLITPIFMHGGILHLLFNMLWLKDLGSMVEIREGTWRLAWVVLFTGVLSNLAQYFIGGPNFVGMSGVIYGLFGYIWIKTKRDPFCGLYLNPSTVTIMLFWLAFCFSGLMGPIANWAHLGGLLAGMFLGWLPSREQ